MLYELNLSEAEMARLEMINAKKGVSFRTEEDLLSKKTTPVAESSIDEISAAAKDSEISNHW